MTARRWAGNVTDFPYKQGMIEHSPPPNTLQRFLSSEAAGGVVLMAAAALALLVANSPLGAGYFAVLETHIGGLSVLHWINDALMAVFFLLVGLEIKREMLVGQLALPAQRILPGLAALGGMASVAVTHSPK